MKIRVPFAWFWYGEQEYGTPEVESGTIAAANPTPPAVGPRIPGNTPLPNDGPTMSEEQLEPYRTPKHEIPQSAKSAEERLEELEQRMRQTESSAMQAQMGDDSKRGGR